MKKYILIFTLLFPMISYSSEFEEAFDLSANDFTRQANRVVVFLESSTDLDVGLQKKDFDYISDSLLAMENEKRLNPVYWFVRGLNAKNLASFYHQLGNGNKTLSYIKEKNKFYEMAMDIDKKHEPHLSARAYAVMKPGLPDILKQQAIKAELSLGGSGEDESYYWYLHWSNVNELQKQGRIDEAKDALATMKKELSENDQKGVFNKLVNKIDQQLKTKNIKKDNASSKQVRDHKAFTEDGGKDDYYYYVIIILGIMLSLIIVAVIFELRRRKK